MTIGIDGCIAQLEREGIVVPEPVKKTLNLSADEQKVVNYLATFMKEGHDTDVQDYHASLDVNISFKRISAAIAHSTVAGSALIRCVAHKPRRRLKLLRPLSFRCGL